MAKPGKIPNFKKIYPEADKKVIQELKKSERKMQYQEYDLKNETIIIDQDMQAATIIPGREDSIERLMEINYPFRDDAEEVEELRRQGYKPREYYEKDEELHQVLTQIGSGVFSPEDPGRYRDLVDSLINFGDHYQVLADYRSYVDCQDKVDELYELQEEWTAKAMLNIANMGYFSSDRTIKEYADHIWHIDPVRL